MSTFFQFIFIVFSVQVIAVELEHRIEGSIIGSLYGDALGGPIEFQQLMKNDLLLRDYQKLKSAYAAWRDFAPAGTITDDTRHKIIFFNALKDKKQLNKKNLAKSYVRFLSKTKYRSLASIWLREYVQAARWSIYEDIKTGKPSSLLFNGQRNASGLLALIPLATLYPANPEKTYLKCIEINFLDTSSAVDLNCSLIAALSSLFAEHANLNRYISTLKNNDPLNLSSTHFVKREVEILLARIEQLVSNNYDSKKFKEKLMDSLNMKYGWEDHVVFSVVLSYLLKNKNNLEQAIYDIIYFGKDTDTYLQLACAIIGAIQGLDFFQKTEVDKIKNRLVLDYGVSVESWFKTIKVFSEKAQRN